MRRNPQPRTMEDSMRTMLTAAVLAAALSAPALAQGYGSIMPSQQMAVAPPQPGGGTISAHGTWKDWLSGNITIELPEADGPIVATGTATNWPCRISDDRWSAPGTKKGSRVTLKMTGHPDPGCALEMSFEITGTHVTGTISYSAPYHGASIVAMTRTR